MTPLQAFNKSILAILFNARSKANKFIDTFTELFSTSSPDLIFITETWLHADDIIILPKASISYNILRCDRLTRGGGVAVCINSDIPYHNVSTLC